MCGIAGFVDSTRKNDLNVLRKITDCMEHRGRDDRGYTFFQNSFANVGLGHRRLSIIDTSSLGHQPMEFENLLIIFNGEIYNYEEIQTELITKGYSFTSSSDTEVILKAFHCWGVDSIQKLNGMFAMAIYDKKTEELFLIRDRIGIKPLYYYFDRNHLVFGSELKPIMGYPDFMKVIDPYSLNLFLFHGYITAPHSIFYDVFKLEPGKYLIYRNRKIEIKTYWSLEQKFKDRKVREDISEPEVIDELDKLVTSSVGYRMIADVPLGCFLSGGFDSSLVTAMMQKLSDRPINTFSIGFKEEKYNEAIHAKSVAKYLGTNHNEIYLSIDDAKNLIPEIPKYYDEPFADSSQLPTMLLSRFARKNVTVALSGDGGDELFCGYQRYDSMLTYQRFRVLSRFLENADKVLPLRTLFTNVDRRMAYLFYLNNDKNTINSPYLHAEFSLKNLVKGCYYQIDKKYFDILGVSDNIQEAHMLQDMITYLPDDICAKVDRATMSVGLEGREPLLDYRLFEYSFTIPHKMKYHYGSKKYILKQLAFRYIPKKLLDRPKMGFGVPIYQWLYSDLNYFINEYFSKEYITSQNIFDHESIQNLLFLFKKKWNDEYYARLIWHLLIFQMWYKEYMEA